MAGGIWLKAAAMIKALWARLFGRGNGEPSGVAVEYNGYRIRPAPYTRGGQYQTCGIIEKEVRGELKEHRFIRAEAHPSREAAVAFSIAKAKQLIDEQGERLFD
jgi:hypothetical protein